MADKAKKKKSVKKEPMGPDDRGTIFKIPKNQGKKK